MTKASWRGCGRTLLVIGGIVVISACLGVSLNRAFVAGPQHSVYSYSTDGEKPEFKQLKGSEGQLENLEDVRLADVREIVRTKSMVPLDGRAEADYEVGHLPGAYSLSVKDFDKRFAEFSSRFPKEGAYLVYCGSGQCGLSKQLASLLQTKGYQQLKIYSAGYNDWFLSGNPVEKGKGS